jgi:hypothetical protein
MPQSATYDREQPREEKPPHWDRDRAHQAWEDAVINAAIEQEKRKFAPPAEPARQETRAGGSREKEQQRQPAPELGKTQAEIRLARTLTPGPQSFANALEDRGFILARVTDDDIQSDLERLRQQWKERRRNPQSWMEHEGGFKALTSEFQDSARRSFDQWEKERDKDNNNGKDTGSMRPLSTPAQRQQALESYVDYVQRKWAEGPKSQLERATGGLAVVTPFGSVYTLTPRNTGLDRDELPEYLKGIDRAPLLSVTDAQAVMEDVREHRRAEWLHRKEQPRPYTERPLNETAAQIRLAYSLSASAAGFVQHLEERGIKIAFVGKDEADRTHINAAFAKELGRFAPEFRHGEFVAVNRQGHVYGLNRATTGEDRADVEKFMATLNSWDFRGIDSVRREQEAEHRAEWQKQRDQERVKNERPLNETAGDIRLAYSLSQSPESFVQKSRRARPETGPCHDR